MNSLERREKWSDVKPRPDGTLAVFECRNHDPIEIQRCKDKGCPAMIWKDTGKTRVLGKTTWYLYRREDC